MSNFKYAEGLTSDEKLKIAEEKKLDILTVLEDEMVSDSDSKSHNVIRTFKQADEKERAAMDAVLIDICGWSMSSLIEIAERNNYIEEDE